LGRGAAEFTRGCSFDATPSPPQDGLRILRDGLNGGIGGFIRAELGALRGLRKTVLELETDPNPLGLVYRTLDQFPGLGRDDNIDPLVRNTGLDQQKPNQITAQPSAFDPVGAAEPVATHGGGAPPPAQRCDPCCRSDVPRCDP